MTEFLTIKQTAERIKEIYPNSPIREHTLRVWEREGRFRSVNAGRKIFISWDSLEEFLAG